jgi:hypothetical protein
MKSHNFSTVGLRFSSSETTFVEPNLLVSDPNKDTADHSRKGLPQLSSSTRTILHSLYLNPFLLQIRKTNVIVNVQDQDGNPVPGAQIKIDQTRQGFPLGIAINYQLPDNPRYQDYVKQRFNWAVFENEAKWYFNENQQGVYNYE